MNTQTTFFKALMTNTPTVPSFLYVILLVCLHSFSLLANTEFDKVETYTVNVCPTGTVILPNQAAVDDFVANYPDCSTISGDLIIGQHILSANSGIVDLSGLSSITTVTGQLRIQSNHDLLSLDGLHSINTVGTDMRLIRNSTLISLNGLGALASVDGDILIQANDDLTDLTGLNANLSIGGNLVISGNNELTNLSGIESQTVIQGNLSITSHRDLTDISALESLTSIGGNFSIADNIALSSLTGLQALNSIGGNLKIVDNPILADCSGICQLVNMPGVISGTITVENNAAGCADLEEVTTDCVDQDEDGVPYEDDNCPRVANPNQEDADGDGVGDVCDDDYDNDGVADNDDPAPLDPSICGDSDGDTCDDCSATAANDFSPGSNVDTNNDGTDTDDDGLCDSGDMDDDNDGVADNNDPEPLNPSICGDSDGDFCDDCSATAADDFSPGSNVNTSNDGTDSDGDGLCDTGDEDDDNDGCPDVDDPNPFVVPTANCQDFTLQLDANGTAILQPEDVDAGSGDACEIAAQAVSPNSFDCNELGGHIVTLAISDGGGNITTCNANIVVVDIAPPTPVCLNTTVAFNGEAEVFLSIAQVWDEASSSDNCGEVYFISMSPDKVTCEQLETIVPVTVTVEDANGNTAECIANVNVTGLPCDFSAPPDGVNCAGGNQATYDPNTDNYTITSDGCYDPNYYSNSDSHGYVGTQLCGDGEVIAQITEVTGNGWAGISMREGIYASDKMLQLMIDGVSMSRRELRQSTGAVAFAHQFPTQGKNWLRLTRSGNTFGAYHSTDGTNWQAVLITNIPMTNCIEVGMVTRNSSPSGTLTATFENFEVKSPSSLQAPNPQGVDIAYSPQPTLEVYPNPAKGEAWIQFNQFTGLFDELSGREMTIEVYNNTGQRIYEVPNQALEEQRIRLDVATWLPGMYLVQMKADGQPVISKKLIVSD